MVNLVGRGVRVSKWVVREGREASEYSEWLVLRLEGFQNK